MEIIDLLPPIERLGEVYRTFVSRLEKKLAEDEKRLDETFEIHRAKLHISHQKTLNSYEVIFNRMLKNLNEQEHIPLVSFFEKAMRSKNIHMYSKAVENLQPDLDNVEKNGGHLEFSSKIADGDYRRLFKGRHNYFSFFDGGFDENDHVIFKVKKDYESSYDRKEREKNKGTDFIVSEPSSTLEQDLEELRAIANDTMPNL